MLVAGRSKSGEWDARFVEYDAEKVEVVEPKDGRVFASNTRQKRAFENHPVSADPSCRRFQNLKRALDRHAGPGRV